MTGVESARGFGGVTGGFGVGFGETGILFPLLIIKLR
jgi:hypothetical protein